MVGLAQGSAGVGRPVDACRIPCHQGKERRCANSYRVPRRWLHCSRSGARLSQSPSRLPGGFSAVLLAVPGASAYFLGGAVVYTYAARGVLLDLPSAALTGLRPATEPYALLLGPHGASASLRHLGSGRDWRDGAGGKSVRGSGGARLPGGRRPGGARSHPETVASPDRLANMRAFAAGALDLFRAEPGAMTFARSQ